MNDPVVLASVSDEAFEEARRSLKDSIRTMTFVNLRSPYVAHALLTRDGATGRVAHTKTVCGLPLGRRWRPVTEEWAAAARAAQQLVLCAACTDGTQAAIEIERGRVDEIVDELIAERGALSS